MNLIKRINFWEINFPVKMKSLEQKLAESEAKLENLSNTRLVVHNRYVSVSIPLKPKDDKVYIPPFKRNHKQKAYFSRLDKGKISDIDTEVSKPMSRSTDRLLQKSIFVPTCHLCDVIGHIRQNCSLLRQKPKSVTRSLIGQECIDPL